MYAIRSYYGFLYALDSAGRLRWKRPLGAEIDASPVATDGRIFLQNWLRQVVALSRADGSVLWRFSYPESPADDHRQGALLPLGELVLLPAWGGTLYALDAATGKVRWQLDGHLPLRAAPVADGEHVITSYSIHYTKLYEIRLYCQLTALLIQTAAFVKVTPTGTRCARRRMTARSW